MNRYSYLHQAELEYIEELYKTFKTSPETLDPEWRKFFDGFELGVSSGGSGGIETEHVRKEMKVLNLIHGYRTRGHLFTKTNPVRTRRKYRPTLDIRNFGLFEDDLETVFQAGEEIGIGPATLSTIIDHLETTYCRSVGVEYMFIRVPERVKWLQERMESTRNLPNFSAQEKRRILQKLNQAAVFENFLHSKYIGQKRFSLAGGETLIPGLDAVIEKGAEMDIRELVIGMPHRGRLNVLTGILGKSYREIFNEFEGKEFAQAIFSGDVKYHLGYNSVVKTQTGKSVKISIAPNPSHLEAVDPVVEGTVRAKLDHHYKQEVDRILPVLIHGDASIAGQGVVYEVIQMSLLDAYHTGGTLHLVINNQLGFTTNYLEGRSSTYCTDVAKVTLSPVFHVNADDAEAVVHTILLALEYRQRFHTDVFVDLLGYRKYGHNEGDEPRFTQPKLYEEIARHPDPRTIYLEKLLKGGEIEKSIAEEQEREFRKELQARFEEAKKIDAAPAVPKKGDECDTLERKFIDERERKRLHTAVDEKTLLNIGEKILTISPQIKVFEKIRKLYDNQKEKLLKNRLADWAIAEYLAYGTLLTEGVPIRIAGQDSKRGTFSHRHAVLYVEDTEEEYVPLNQVDPDQAPFRIYNSLLSEYAALGFEYGYSCATPNGLTIWEAQFGDFINGAQVIIDQFLASSEAKWNRMNGLVLYLPHGYEGQGPEHSSARMERFLELCANDNMRVANCTTPANLFHLLREHMKLPFRVPLVLFTPKSLLRHPEVVSPVEDFTSGIFREVIDDGLSQTQKVKTVLLCSGKIYYDLSEKRRQDGRRDVAIIRMEQLYPLPEPSLKKTLDRYKNAERFIWVQEEPENMGAWPYLCRAFRLRTLELVSRPPSATPATGFHRQHVLEQKALVEKAFGF